jgi:probable rRNA maturation factor
MRHRVQVAADAARLPLARRRVAEIALAVLRAERAASMTLSITFVSKRSIAAMNARHLGHSGPTDVISFGLPAYGPGAATGDIYIAPEVARENARVHGTTVRDEVARLVIHGVLHVLGHEHPEGPGRLGSRMWRRQEALLTSLAARNRRPARRRSARETG